MTSRTCVAVALFVLGVSSMTGEAHADIKMLRAPLSAGRLAFTYIDGAAVDIYVVDFRTMQPTALVKSPADDEYPTWSPDGSRLVFYSDQAKDREIYSIRADGTDLKRLTNSPGPDEDPDWSPDGKQIVFQSSRANRGNGRSLFVMNADGSKPRPLALLPKTNSVPRWSPRGDEVLFSTNQFWPGWDLMVLNLKSKKVQQLTRGFKSYCRGFWDYTGSSFVFAYGAGSEIDLWEQKRGEEQPRPFLSRPGREYDPVWADKGRKWFFVGETAPGNDHFEVFLFDRESGLTEQITESTGSIRFLSWTEMPTLTELSEQVRKEVQESVAPLSR